MAPEKDIIPDTDNLPPDDTTPRKVPQRGIRKRLFEKGDVLVVSLIGENHPSLPPGAMLPIEGVPQFGTLTEARRWVRNDSGDLLRGHTVLIVWAKARMAVEVVNKPTVRIEESPRKVVEL